MKAQQQQDAGGEAAETTEQPAAPGETNDAGLSEEEAAVRIQALQRGASARKEVAAMKAQQQQGEQQPPETGEESMGEGGSVPAVEGSPKAGSPFEEKPSRIPRGAAPPAGKPSPSPVKSTPKRRQKKEAAAGPLGLPAWNSSPKVRRPLHDLNPPEEPAETPAKKAPAPSVARKPSRKPRPPPAAAEAAPPPPPARKARQAPPPQQQKPARQQGRRAREPSPAPEPQVQGESRVEAPEWQRAAAPPLEMMEWAAGGSHAATNRPLYLN